MKLNAFRAVGFIAAVAIAGFAHAQTTQAVEWKVSEGGNGHWYRVMAKVGDWFACRAAAQAAGGDLGSPATAAENSFVAPLIPAASSSQWNRTFLGARQIPGSAAQSGWYWVDGSQWSYTN